MLGLGESVEFPSLRQSESLELTSSSDALRGANRANTFGSSVIDSHHETHFCVDLSAVTACVIVIIVLVLIR